MLRINNLSSFSIKEISFELEEGYMMCLLGRNGSGKTTLLNTIYGMQKADRGEVLWNGTNVRKNMYEFRSQVAYIGEENWCFEGKSMAENISLLRLLYGTFDQDLYEKYLKTFDLTADDSKKECDALSTGQKIKFQLAFALARSPKFMLLDEPMANLDPVLKTDLLEILHERVAEDRMGIILSTHLVDDVSDMTDYIGVLENGSMSILLFLVLVFYRNMVFTGDITDRVGAGLAVMVVILFSASFYRRYLRTSDSGKLSTVMRSHAFPVKEYFAYIRKQLAVWIVVLSACITAEGIVYKQPAYAVCGVAAVVCIPLSVGVLMQKRFAYSISHRQKGWQTVLFCALDGAVYLATLMFSVICLFMFGFVAWAVVSDFFAGGLDCNEIIYRSYGDSAILGVMIVAATLFALSLVWKMGKNAAVIRAVLGAATVLLCTVEIVMEHYNYVDTREDEIVVSSFDGKTSYSYDEIDRYEVYCENESIQIKLTFDDGNTATLLGGVVTNTDAYSEAYYSDYNFASALVQKFSACGATGSITDIEKLRESVKDLDERCSAGLKEVIAFVVKQKNWTCRKNKPSKSDRYNFKFSGSRIKTIDNLFLYGYNIC